MPRFAAVLALLLSLSLAHGDVVRLRGGRTLVGKIIKQDAESVTIRTGASVMTVPRAKIESIEKGEAPSEAYTRRAAKLADDDVKGHLELAQYCAQHRLNPQAVAELRHVLSLDPAQATARRLLQEQIDPKAASLVARAKRLQAQGKPEAAEAPLTQLLETYPESAHAAAAHHHLAVGYAARGQHDQALVRWRRALNLRPDYAEACEGAASACIAADDWPEALNFTRQAAGIHKEGPDAERLRKRAKAIDELVKLREAQPKAADRADRLVREGNLLMGLGLPERGLLRLEDAYDAGARDPKLLAFLADRYEKQGRVPQALELCDILARADPTDNALLKRRARLDRLLLIPKALETRDRAARQRLMFDIARSEAGFAYIEAALRNSALREPQPAGLVEGTFMVDEVLARAKYACYVPNGYDPRRPWPLILAFHRDSDTGKEHFYNWENVAQTEKVLICCPTAPQEGKWKFDDLHLPLSALRHLRAIYNIDTDRVSVAGTGGGGLLAWAVAIRHPDRFAALVVRNTRIDEVSRLYLPAANNLAIYQLVSERAPPEMIGTLREADSALARWKYPARREEVPGHRHPAMPELNPKVGQWLTDKRRNPYPHTVRLISFQHENAESYWVRIDRFAPTVFDPDRKVRSTGPMGIQLTEDQILAMYLGRMERELGSVAATIHPGNRIRVDTRHVLDLTLFLDDALVDLDRPVVISLNGEIAFRGTLARSLDTLFDTARRHRDPRLCYSASVSLKVK